MLKQFVVTVAVITACWSYEMCTESDVYQRRCAAGRSSGFEAVRGGVTRVVRAAAAKQVAV